MKKLSIHRDYAEDQRSRENIDKYIFNILVLVIILVPLLIGGHVTKVESPLITEYSMLGSGYKIDIFTFFKFITLIILTSLALTLFLYKLFILNYKITANKIWIFFVIFLVSVIISTMLSETKTIALNGQYNRSDGAISYICYTILLFVAMNINYPKKALEHVLYAFSPLVIINFVLTLINFLGHDALNYSLVRKFITLFLPEGAGLAEESYLVGTLNHWNYMSGMFAIVTIMYISWVIFDTNKRRQIINFCIALLSMMTMLMSTSASGFVTVVCITPFFILIAWRAINRRKILVILGMFCLITGLIINILSTVNSKVWDESIGIFISNNPYDEKASKDLSLNMPGWGVVTAYSADNTFELPELPEANWGAGTGRIYIWTETIKLLEGKLLFGNGLDTLMYNFPHFNSEARGNLNEVTIVDKPHSLYMGILYGTGLLGFIGFMGILITIAWEAFIVVVKREVNDKFLIVLSLTWLAFLIQALFNDSLPGTTTPLFILAGILMAHIYKEKDSNLSNNEGNKHE